jgi:hypothetical protein
MANSSGFMRAKSSMGSHEARVEVELMEDMICEFPLSDDDDGLRAAL